MAGMVYVFLAGEGVVLLMPFLLFPPRLSLLSFSYTLSTNSRDGPVLGHLQTLRLRPFFR